MWKNQFSEPIRALLADDEWLVAEEGYHPRDQIVYESIFCLASGYMGNRASAEEGFCRRTLPANYVHGVFDRSEAFQRELANTPDWCKLKMYYQCDPIAPEEGESLEGYLRVLDMKHGVVAKRYVCLLYTSRAGIPYNKGVVFENVENLVLDGQGSTWMMHGLLSPVSIWNCKHVRLKNFSIDWERPLFSVGTVLSHEGDEVVVRIDDDFPVKGGEPIWALMDYDRIARRFGLIWKYRNMSALELIAPQTVRFHAQLRETLHVGSALILRHVGNYRP